MFHDLFLYTEFFSKQTFYIIFFLRPVGVRHSCHPDQAQPLVESDLGPNCLQRLSVDNRTCHYQVKSKTLCLLLSSHGWIQGGGGGRGSGPPIGISQVARCFLRNTGTDTPLEKQMDPLGPIASRGRGIRTPLCEIC